MASWEGKSRGTPLGYKIFVIVLRYLGIYPAYFQLYFVVAYFFFFSPKTTPYILSFLRKKIGYGFFKSYVGLYKTYHLLGQTLIDRVVVSSGLSKKITSESFGGENLRELVASGKGGVLLGSHIGNYGIASQFLLNYDKAINIVVYDIEDAQIRSYLEGVTGGRKYNVILIKDDMSHIYEIGEALQRQEIICMTADRFMPGSRTGIVRFFDEEAHLPLGPFQIIKTFKAPYTFVYGVKKNLTHYNCFARPYRTVEPGTTSLDIMQQYATDLELMAKEYPEQWFNFYDFWKKP